MYVRIIEYFHNKLGLRSFSLNYLESAVMHSQADVNYCMKGYIN